LKEIFAVFKGNEILKMSDNKNEIIEYFESFPEYEQDKMHCRAKVNNEWILMMIPQPEYRKEIIK